MGRTPVIRRLVLNALRDSKNLLRFSEIREEIGKALSKKVNDKSIAENLTYLVKEGLAEKLVKSNHVVYRLTSNYFSTQAQDTLNVIFDQSKNFDFHYDFEGDNPPFMSYIQKTKYPYLQKETICFAPEIQDWAEPVGIIASRMLESLNELPVDTQESITRFFAFAYWVGVQRRIAQYTFGETLPETIKRCKDFAVKVLRRAEEEWKDTRRAKAEKALLDILELTNELATKDNLLDFLVFLKNKTSEVKNLQSIILENTGHYMQGGEKIWDCFLNFHDIVISALNLCDLIPNGRHIAHTERHFFGYSTIWDEVIGRIIEPDLNEWFANIKGGIPDSIKAVKSNVGCLEEIKKLPFESKVLITYVWGYPDIFLIADKSFLPAFEEWLAALKQGNLDHRAWIFDRVDKVAKAYRRVKSGKEPANDIIDLEHWTLRDIYIHHPRGKDTDFWEELLKLLELRKGANNNIRG
jgi:DNA-binding HxlR family transcriptional regulator